MATLVRLLLRRQIVTASASASADFEKYVMAASVDCYEPEADEELVVLPLENSTLLDFP